MQGWRFRFTEHEFESPENASKVYDRLLNDREFPLGVIFGWTKI